MSHTNGMWKSKITAFRKQNITLKGEQTKQHDKNTRKQFQQQRESFT